MDLVLRDLNGAVSWSWIWPVAERGAIFLSNVSLTWSISSKGVYRNSAMAAVVQIGGTNEGSKRRVNDSLPL